jgi:hypothetical protein
MGQGTLDAGSTTAAAAVDVAALLLAPGLNRIVEESPPDTTAVLKLPRSLDLWHISVFMGQQLVNTFRQHSSSLSCLA